jgi:hypothetical protein
MPVAWDDSAKCPRVLECTGISVNGLGLGSYVEEKVAADQRSPLHPARWALRVLQRLGSDTRARSKGSWRHG